MDHMSCTQQYPILREQYFFDGILRNIRVLERAKYIGMPASTLEPVSGALRDALSKNSSDDFLSSQLSGSSRRVLCANIEFEATENYQNTVLNNLKSKYIVLQTNKATTSSKKPEMGAEETLPAPQRVLFPQESVQLGWSNSDWSVGAGMVNMGNTCYLNSTLQALLHVPALVNWLLSDKQHMSQCEDSGGGQGGCIICAMSKTLQASQQRNSNAIRPWLILSKLRIVCRHLVPGRQEDAHEFLRYLVEAMEKAYILRFRNLSNLDTRTKETTPLNQILGGYLRSAVRCLECGHVSTTFQHFQDLLLDIRKINTLDDALDLYFSREKLDDLAYHCENCQKKVLATKQFSLERAPMVLCIQLKRFSVTNNKITKHITFRQRLELTRFARRKPTVPLVYRLVSLVTHVGQTVGCGHYTAVAQAPSGNFYQFDDSMVRPISQQSVFSTNAYIMLYELECPRSTFSPKSPVPTKTSFNNKTITSTEDSAHSTAKPSTPSVIALGNIPSPHLNGASLQKNSVNNHNFYSQNGSSSNRVTNGVKSHNSTAESSDSSDSEPETRENGTQIKSNLKSCTNSPKSNTNSPKSNNNSPNSSLSSYSSNVNSPKNGFKEDTEKSPPSTSLQSSVKKIVNSNNATSENKEEKKSSPQKIINGSVSQNVTKLVPYDVDDSSSSTDDLPTNPHNNSQNAIPSTSSSSNETVRSQIVTKAGAWRVSPTNNSFKGPSLEGQAGWNRRQREAVSELMHMSHEGYSAPVSTWNGTRAVLDREINNDRREDRKRTMNDTNPDKVKPKQAKHNNYNGNKSANPGYNPFQEYNNNNRKWQTDNHYYKSHYNNGMGHRYQRRGGYHNNRHREKFRH